MRHSSVVGSWGVMAAAALAAAVIVAPGRGSATASIEAAEIDRAAIAKLASLYGINATVIAHLDLTRPFHTKSQSTLVIAKQPDEESADTDGLGDRRGVISICFVENATPDCSEAMFRVKYREENIELASGESPFYELFASDVVYSGAGKTLPLLRIKTCTISGANGSCGVSTFLYAYDRATDRFRSVFFNLTGRNNNEETRFIDSGPLLGDVIVARPTDNAPFTYFVEVHKRKGTGSYARVLRYRSRTGYADGNPLAVIDSEMPEILRRLGRWRSGDALPVPPTMPAGCERLVLRNGVEWCEPNHGMEPTPR